MKKLLTAIAIIVLAFATPIAANAAKKANVTYTNAYKRDFTKGTVFLYAKDTVITLYKGQTITFRTETKAKNWKSSNSKIAKITKSNTKSATVKMKNTGNATLSYKLGGKKYTCTITSQPAGLSKTKKTTSWNSSDTVYFTINGLKVKSIDYAGTCGYIIVSGRSNKISIVPYGNGSPKGRSAEIIAKVTTASNKVYTFTLYLVGKGITVLDEVGKGDFEIGSTLQLLYNGKVVSGWTSDNPEIISVTDKGVATLASYGFDVNHPCVSIHCKGKSIKLSFDHPCRNGHTFSINNSKITKEATKYETGTRVFTCEKCGYESEKKYGMYFEECGKTGYFDQDAAEALRNELIKAFEDSHYLCTEFKRSDVLQNYYDAKYGDNLLYSEEAEKAYKEAGFDVIVEDLITVYDDRKSCTTREFINAFSNKTSANYHLLRYLEDTSGYYLTVSVFVEVNDDGKEYCNGVAGLNYITPPQFPVDGYECIDDDHDHEW